MLIKTIRMETNDETLFSKSAPLLVASSDLCYHTVNCSALNAEELRREKGIEVCVYPLLGEMCFRLAENSRLDNLFSFCKDADYDDGFVF